MLKSYLVILSFFIIHTSSMADNSQHFYEVDGDIILGNKNAKVTIIDYSSFSCPGCAMFHNDILPLLEEQYINSGKAKLIFRNYPLRAIDLKAAVIPICGNQDQYYPFIKVLFQTQKNWANESSHPIETLEHIAKLGGLSGEAIQKCFNDKTLEEKVIISRQIAQDELGVKATPTLIINGKAYEGYPNKTKLFEMIDSAYTAKN